VRLYGLILHYRVQALKGGYANDMSSVLPGRKDISVMRPFSGFVKKSISLGSQGHALLYP
jgi:hypothetical protein